MRRSRSMPGGQERETLFTSALRRDGADASATPLAERMRPRALEELVGQEKLLRGKRLGAAIEADRLPSLIVWGPPGVGKTTLARIVAAKTKAAFVPFSAVLGGLPELRAIAAEARERRAFRGERTIVFVDEIHRFHKGQQDAFLPHVEDGTLTLIGATTENPSFSVNAALLSRCTVVRLEPLSEAAIVLLLGRALGDRERGLGALDLACDEGVLGLLAKSAGGDGRRALSLLDTLAEDARGRGEKRLTKEALAAVAERAPLLYDRAGEEHYNVVSAFIKSMRGSDPDAAVYWMMRMLDAGDDPLFLLRRMLIFASEDVGNADPRALLVVNAADQAFRRMGLPEGLYPLAQAAIYLACTAKSNAVKNAWQRARALIATHGSLPVPLKLRNAVTAHMRDEGYGEGYRYAHDFEGGVVPGETYLPDELAGETLYEPVDRGEEQRIAARLAALRATRRREK